MPENSESFQRIPNYSKEVRTILENFEPVSHRSVSPLRAISGESPHRVTATASEPVTAPLISQCMPCGVNSLRINDDDYEDTLADKPEVSMSFVTNMKEKEICQWGKFGHVNGG